MTSLARGILARVHYRHIFSRRMIGMLCQFQRPDVVLDRLKQDEWRITDLGLIKQIARNLIIWVERPLIGDALDLIRRRCGKSLFNSQGLEVFFEECLERRANIVTRLGDRENVWRHEESVREDSSVLGYDDTDEED